MRMGFTREWAIDHFLKPIKESLIVSDKLDLTIISSKIREMENRMNLSCAEDSVFAVASVVFFELTDDILRYDFIKGRENIQLWKSDQEPASFFLNEPIGSLTGFSNHSSEAIQTYLKEMEIAIRLIQAQSSDTFRGN
jgi:hypothetical protein